MPYAQQASRRNLQDREIHLAYAVLIRSRSLSVKAMAAVENYGYPYKQVYAMRFCREELIATEYSEKVESMDIGFKKFFAFTSSSKMQLETKSREDFEASRTTFRDWVIDHLA
ncbi:hypothetical protein BDZ45DRAFT_748390 [Acephala macrosclerotiorum]|nr:hypothetical protein BDZ45DRAFT_748390 [Acephala macrosclerotiorum]